MDEDDPEDGDSAEEHESEPDQPVMLRTIAAFIKASKESTPIVTQRSHSQTPVNDNSVTGKFILFTYHTCECVRFFSEPESEPEADQVSTKRKSPGSEQIMPASKRRKTPCLDGTFNLIARQDDSVDAPIDESETEPESDIDLPTVSKLLAPNTVKLSESDSETEPEDEDETYPNPVKPNVIL